MWLEPTRRLIERIEWRLRGRGRDRPRHFRRWELRAIEPESHPSESGEAATLDELHDGLPRNSFVIEPGVGIKNGVALATFLSKDVERAGEHLIIEVGHGVPPGW